MKISPSLKSCFGVVIFFTVLVFLGENYEQVSRFILSPFFNGQIIEEVNRVLVNIPDYAYLGIVVMAVCPFVVKVIRIIFLMRPHRVLGVFVDKSHLGIHVFAQNYRAGADTYQPSEGVLSVLHYFIRLKDGKIFLTKAMSYTNEVAQGRPGYKEFNSLEEDILKSQPFKKTLEKLSKKVGTDLDLEKMPQKSNYALHIQKQPLEINSSLKNSRGKKLIFHSCQEGSYVLTLVENKEIHWQFSGKNNLRAGTEDCFILDDQILIFNKYDTEWDEGIEVLLIDLSTGKLCWKVKL